MTESLGDRARQRTFSLDLLRVIAIVMVFVFHFPRSTYDLGPWARFGWMGVDLFFVLSGYLIGGQIIRRLAGFSFKTFYVRRALRTLPVYFVVLAAYFLIPGFREKPELPALWRFLTFTQNFGLTPSAFSHAWSLCIEEQFYLVCPFVIVALTSRRRAWMFVCTIVLGGMFYRHFAWLKMQVLATEPAPWDLYIQSIYYPTWGRLDGLVFGVGLSALPLPSRRWLIGLVGAIGFGFSCWMFTDRLAWSTSVFGYPLLALSFTMILAAVAELHGRVPGVSQLAILSYSFYLIHKEAIHALDGFVNGLTLVAVSFVASVVAAFAMYHLIERPFLVLRDRLK